MTLSISYTELQGYISSHYHQDVRFVTVNQNTVNILITVRVAIISKTVNVNVNIVQAKGQDITMSYGSGLGVDLIIKGILKFLKKTLPEYGNVVEERTDNNLVLHLAEINQLKEVFEYAELQAIRFSEEAVCIDVRIK